MRYVLAVILLAVAAVAHAQQGSPAPVQVEDGVAVFGWSNDVGADLIIVTLNRDDCAIVGHYAVDPAQVQQVIQVPRPTDDAACKLRLADQITLLRYKVGFGYIDQLGPYVQRGRVLLPVVGR